MEGKTPEQSTQDGSTPVANAFELSFLHALTRRGEVATASEAEMTGPWKICRLPDDRYGLFRDWEEPGDGGNGHASGGAGGSGQSGSEARPDVPEAVFRHRAHALLAAAVLPATGREPLFKLDSRDRSGGFAVEAVWGDRWATLVGRLRCFHPEVTDALHVAETVVRSPAALAYLLEAAGPTALELAGRLLSERLRERPSEDGEGNEPG